MNIRITCILLIAVTVVPSSLPGESTTANTDASRVARRSSHVDAPTGVENKPPGVAAERPAPQHVVSHARGTPQMFSPSGLTISTPPISLHAAGRIIDQATFGANADLLIQVIEQGIDPFVEEELNVAPYQMPGLLSLGPDYINTDCRNWNCNVEARWWANILSGSDQLNQRVAFILSQIFNVNFESQIDARYEPHYLNVLSADALTNWYNIMIDMTLDPAVGQYVSMLNSPKPPSGTHAEENFARENMQLFNLGVYALNIDGTYKLDVNGNQIPNYTADQVQAFARAFTGWTFANYHNNCSVPSSFQYYYWPDTPGQNCPMVPVEQLHDSESKVLLGGTVLPAGQSAEQDLLDALQNIFDDPSLPPFISKRLIQGLVTSNPSPDYVKRVATIFTNNGVGVRGDMKAVVKAILLDPDARQADTGAPATAGRIREPFLQYTAMLRALSSPTPGIADAGVFQQRLNGYVGAAGEPLHAAPSVFGFFQSDFTITVGEDTWYAPEAELDNNQTYQGNTEKLTDTLDNDFEGQVSQVTLNTGANSVLGTLAAQLGPEALVEALNLLLMHGDMPSDMQSIIEQAVSGIDPSSMVKNAAFLVLMSGQYRVIE